MNLLLNTTIYSSAGVREETRTAEFLPDPERENELLNLYPDVEYQTLEGFGGALTDAAGYVYRQMKREDQEKLVETYFGKSGIGYRMVRIPLDSCDFSVEGFQAVTDASDKTFSTFSIEREKKYIYPLWEAIQKTDAEVEVLVTPWSPPDFMKTNGMRTFGGSLKEEYREAYAEYLCRYLEEFGKIGIPVKRMSVQNEPKAMQTWDSCIMDAKEEKIFLRDYLYPALKKHGFGDVEIYIWDHNKERIFERVCDIMDETMAGIVKGVAFHWYSGDHFEALQLIREKFPSLKLVMSEGCIEYSKFSADAELMGVAKYAHEIIGNLNHGMNAFYDWNILLDENGGPNYVGNFCDAPFLYHTGLGQLHENMTLSAIAHFSKGIRPGAVRIGFSRYTQELEATAFKNQDGTIAVVMSNQSGKEIPVTLRLSDSCADLTLPAGSIVTAMISGWR